MGAIKKPVIEQKWQEHEPKMDGDSITVKVLINGVLFKPTLIDTGCKYYSIVDKNFITELRFPRVKIPLKPITGFIKKTLRNLKWKSRKLQNSLSIFKDIGEIYLLILYPFY